MPELRNTWPGILVKTEATTLNLLIPGLILNLNRELQRRKRQYTRVTLSKQAAMGALYQKMEKRHRCPHRQKWEKLKE